MAASLGENWMVAPESMDQDELLIRITIKSSKHRKDFDLLDTITVKELKDVIAVEFSTPLDQQCIIFAGKILKDYERLKDTGVTDGMTLHLVIKSAHRTDDPLPSALQADGAVGAKVTLPPADIGATPFGLGAVGGLTGLSNIGMGSANFIDLQQSLQKELFRNPQLLKSLMNNPLVTQITSTPGLMQQLLAANPQMRELMEKNPEIDQMLSNSALMSQMLEVARKPAMLRELLRPQDRPITLVDDDSATELGSDEAEAGGVKKEGTEDKEAELKSKASDKSGAKAIPSVPSDGSVFSEPSVRSLLLQMLDNPQLMTNILQSSYMQSMVQHMSTNPQLMSQMLSYNHVFANNPALMQQLQQNIPTMCQQLGSSELQGLVTNPRAIQAMLQVQEGLEQLRTEVPELVTRLGIAPSILPGQAGADQSQPDPYAQFLSHVLTNYTPAGTATPQPTTDVEKYAIQLSQLATLGFTEPEHNLHALVETSGNLNEAINRLLQQRKET